MPKVDSIVLLSGEMHCAAQEDGFRRLLNDLRISIDGVEVVFLKGFVTDYTSWPSFLPGPNFRQTDKAGVCHDWFFKYKTLGFLGRDISLFEANKLWYRISRAGNERTKTHIVWSAMGFAGLSIAGWFKWRKYRKQDAKDYLDFSERVEDFTYMRNTGVSYDKFFS